MTDMTLAILKPDCMRQRFVGKVLQHLEDAGFEIVAGRITRLTRETAAGFYAVHKERPFFPDLMEFMTSGRVMPLALRAPDAVAKLRKVIGATNPEEAENGTIRKLYAENIQNNIIHASDSDENAGIELAFFFTRQEITANAAS